MTTNSDALPFLQHCAYGFSWSDLSNKTIMDIGCGIGNNSTKRFLEMFPDVEKIIAVDQSTEAIDQARYENRYPSIEYHVADIQEWSNVEQWEGQIDVIISHYCFNCFPDANIGFQNVHRLLVPGGTAGVLFTLQSDMYEWLKEVGQKYNQYAADMSYDPPTTHASNLHASHYIPLLQEMGFYIMECVDDYQSWEFPNSDDFKNYLGGYCPLSTNIPSEIMDSYTEDVFQIFKKHSPLNERGFISFKCRNAKVLVKKK